MTPTLSPDAPTLLASAAVLVSWWKALLFLLTLYPWAWVISKIYDKHAARFHLPRRKWNLFHMAMGLAATAAFFLLPIRHDFGFLAGWGLAIFALAADLYVFAYVANRDERVPQRHHIRFNLDQLRAAREKRKSAKLQSRVSLVIRGPDRQVIPPPQPETPEYEVRVAAEELFTKAHDARASQADIAPAGKDGSYALSFLIDGVRQPAESLPAPAALKLIDFWKSAARLDTADRRRRLQNTISVERGNIRYALTVSSTGVTGGMRGTLVIDPENAVSKKAEDLGFLDSQMEELRALTAEEKGTVLLAAPLDGGRTTTLYAVVAMHDAYTKNVQTIEFEPQAAIEGVRLNKFEPEKEGAEFSTLVRSVLRRDPDVVAVAELPDANTAKEIARADQERSRIYISMKGDSALAAVQTFVRAVGDPKAAAAALHGAIAQRLMRRLCPNCRVAYPPSPDMLKKLGVPEGKVQQLYKKGGQVLIKNKPEICPMCQGVGYIGQIGVFEVFRLGPEERDLIAAGNLAGLRAALRKRQLPGIQQVAIRRAIEGITSVEEVTRVTSDAAQPQPPQAAPAPAPQPQP